MSTLVPPALVPWVGLALLMGVLQAIPGAADWLRYDRVAIGDGQLWRILTANFIHLGWSHLALNVAGLLAVGWLFAEDYPRSQWIVILLICSVATSIGLYFFTPEIKWCVGLSGALHGLFAAGAIALIFDGVSFGWGLLAGCAGKLLYEQTVGSMPFSAGVVGGSVVTDAHLWGAIGGVVIALLLHLWRRNDARL